MKNVAFAALMSLALGACATAEPSHTLSPASIEAHAVVDVWPGVAPGSETWTQQEITGSFGNGRSAHPIVRNVTHPTITAYFPDPAHATGTGVIVAPGGGFLFLSIKSEGTDVAQWLAAHGVAAFVLKYRTHETPVDEAGVGRMFADLVSQSHASVGGGSASTSPLAEPAQFATADAVQALSVVRAHAQEWGVDPQRIGIVGFSAGARVAAGLLLQADPGNRPAFAAPIYGGLFGENIQIPRGLPPVFAAVAADDPLALQTSLELVTALRATGARPELHMFNAGGHGFGLNEQGATSDHWIDEFYWWMEFERSA